MFNNKEMMDKALAKTFPHLLDEKHRQESVSLGLIPDKDKIRLLKAEMYRFVRSGRPVDNHVKALNVLLRSREIDDKRPYSWGEQLASVVSLACTLGLIGLGGAVILNISCLTTQTPFCKDVRATSANVIEYFMYEGNNGN
jgi:hypothetical protein